MVQSVKNLPAIKETACSTGDPALIPGSGRSPGEGNGSPFQYSCLGNPMDGSRKQSDMTKRLHFSLVLFYFCLKTGNSNYMEV